MVSKGKLCCYIHYSSLGGEVRKYCKFLKSANLRTLIIVRFADLRQMWTYDMRPNLFCDLRICNLWVCDLRTQVVFVRNIPSWSSELDLHIEKVFCPPWPLIPVYCVIRSGWRGVFRQLFLQCNSSSPPAIMVTVALCLSSLFLFILSVSRE